VSVEQHSGRGRPATPPISIESVAIGRLQPYLGNARTHSKKQVRQIADSIHRFGFTNPVLISDNDEIIAGHGRVEAAKLLGMESVPTLRLPHLNAAQRRAYVIADNKLALNAGWDRNRTAGARRSRIRCRGHGLLSGRNRCSARRSSGVFA